MASLADIQKRLDDKTLDPRTLNQNEQKAMDALFKKGALTGYNNVLEIAQERDKAKEEIITSAEQQRNPSGSSNFGYVIAGDLLGTAAVYTADRKKLIAAAKNAKEADNFKVSQSKFGRILGNITEKTVGKRFKPLRKLFKNTSDFFSTNADKARRFTFSQAGRTEAKAIGASSIGAGGGAALYEYEQYTKGLASNVLYDLGDISDREIDKMSPLERGQAAVLAEMTNALIWNTAGTALSPIVGKMLKATGRTVFGLRGAETKAAAKEANELGLPLNAVELTANKNNAFAKLVNSYPKVIGQIPIVSSSILRQRGKQAAEMTETVFKHLTRDFGPIFHSHLFGKEIYPTIIKNHKLFVNTINANYEQLLRRADIMGNPAIIPSLRSRKIADDILKKRQDMTPQGMGADIDSEALELLKEIQNIGSYNKLDTFMTPKQFLGYQERIHYKIGQAAARSKKDPLVAQLPILRKAMEEDFAQVANKNYSQEFMAQNQKLNDDFLAIKQAEGDAAAQKFLQKTQRDMDEFGKSLTRANKFFADVIGSLEGTTGLKTALRMYDSELLSKNSLGGIIGEESEVLSKMFGNMANRVVKNGGVEEVLEFKFLLGLDDKLQAGKKIKTGFEDLAGKKTRTTTGRVLEQADDFTAAQVKKDITDLTQDSGTLFQRFTGRAVTDAFMNSFERINRDKFSTLQGRIGLQEITEQNKNEMLNKVFDTDFIDNHLPTVPGTAGFGVVQKRGLKVGETFKQVSEETADNLLIKDTSAVRTGVFNYQAFDDALGFSQPGAKDRFIELFGGGVKGRTHYKHFDGIMRALQAKGEVSYGDISTFLSRRLQLGGVTAIAGGGALAGGFGAMSFPVAAGLLFGAVLLGRAVMSPTVARNLLEVLTPAQKAAVAANKNKMNIPFGITFGMTTPKKRQALISLVNQISNDDPTAFEGKYVPEVTEEMVINYLNSGKMIVPNTNNIKPSDINSKFKDSFLPKTTTFEKAPVEEKNNLAGLDQGIRDGVERTYANRTLVEQQDVRAAEERGEAAPQQVTETPDFDPVQLGSGEPQTISPQVQTSMPEVPTMDYTSIFPNDPLGEMIAKRNELRNRQA